MAFKQYRAQSIVLFNRTTLKFHHRCEEIQKTPPYVSIKSKGKMLRTDCIVHR